MTQKAIHLLSRGHVHSGRNRLLNALRDRVQFL
jgi:hypothetical protein